MTVETQLLKECGNFFKGSPTLDSFGLPPISFKIDSFPLFQLKEGRDDLGRGNNPMSLQTGNSGRPIACCVIGLADAHNWENPFLQEVDPMNPLPVNPASNLMVG